MRIPVDLEKIIENSDPIYTFNEIMEQIDLYKYFAEKGSKTGRPRFDSVKLLKIILFAFMENGYASVGNIEKLFKSRGKKRAIIAIARMILTAIYNMLSTGEVWNLCDLFKIDMPDKLKANQEEKAVKKAVKFLEKRGYLVS